MRLKKPFVLFFFISIVTIKSHACECTQTSANSTLESYFNNAKLVFEGETIERKHGKNQVLGYTKIKTLRWWKGKSEDYIIINRLAGKQCDFSFQTSQRYLVFALWDKKHKVYRVSTCGYSKRSSESKHEFSQLSSIILKIK